MMITDHPYISCHFAQSEAALISASAIGLCMSPYGINRCHKRDCGKKREEHEVCCEGKDVACPTHGTDIGRDIAR